MKLEVAACPNCGGDLRVPPDRQTIICMYCGKTILVQDAISKVNNSSTSQNFMTLASAARKSSNYEEAYDYYSKVLELDPKNWEAWLYKGEAAGWQSTLGNIRINETIDGVLNAVKVAPDKEWEIKVNGAQIINDIAAAIHKLSIKHLYEYGSDLDVQHDFFEQTELVLRAWEIARNCDPNNSEILDNLISLIKRQLEGFQYKGNDEWETVRTIPIPRDARNTLVEAMNLCIADRKALDPSYVPPQIRKRGIFGKLF